MKWRESTADLLCAHVGWASSSLWAMAMKLMGLSKHLLPFSVTCGKRSHRPFIDGTWLCFIGYAAQGGMRQNSCTTSPNQPQIRLVARALHLGVAVLLGAAVLDAALGRGDAGRAAAGQHSTAGQTEDTTRNRILLALTPAPGDCTAPSCFLSRSRPKQRWAWKDAPHSSSPPGVW